MGVLIGLAMLAFSCYYFYCVVIAPIQIESQKNSIKGYATFDEKERILTVTRRGEGLAKAISIDKHEVYNVSHKGEEYVYTGVTVGNVTTGGVHKNEAYNYISGSTKTGKYCLMYAKIHTLREIFLSDELFALAKKSNISKYLDEKNKSIRVVEKVKYSRMTQDALYAGNINAAWMMGQREETAGFPNYDKCEAILHWLSTES